MYYSLTKKQQIKYLEFFWRFCANTSRDRIGMRHRMLSEMAKGKSSLSVFVLESLLLHVDMYC